MTVLRWIRRSIPALTLAATVAGCATHEKQCRALCTQLVADPCNLPSWPTEEQCVRGCMDDLYRRDDAEEILACYQGAIDGPTRAQAEALVDRAIGEGLFEAESVAGTFDREFEVEVLDRRSCDLFQLIDCKTRADSRR